MAINALSDQEAGASPALRLVAEPSAAGGASPPSGEDAAGAAGAPPGRPGDRVIADAAGGEFSRGMRAAISSGRLLATCRALLERARLDLGFHPSGRKEFASDPLYVEARALLSYVDRGADEPEIPGPLDAIAGASIARFVPSLKTAPLNALHRADIHTVGDLMRWTAEDLVSIQGFGWSSLHHITRELDKRGLTFSVAPCISTIKAAPGAGHR